MKLHGDVAERYFDFAAYAAADSPCFEAWARGVADDPRMHAWLADLPEAKQQPNLVFASARWHGAAAPAPYDELRRVLVEHEAEVKATILARATQTNEVGRLATLMPVLATLAGPLGLVEVGASAGLCLFPDRYDYVWTGRGREGGVLAGSGGPTLTAQVAGAVPLPTRPLQVVQRIGLDLHPLDVFDEDAVAWLTTLVWPEDEERRARLRAAVEVARTEPPDLRKGDLLTRVPGLVAEASRWGTAVVFHSAVVAYLDDAERGRFAAMMRELVDHGRCHWVSNEGPGVVPGVAIPEPSPAGRFLLALDGEPVAWTHGHGHAMDWL